MTLQKKFMVDFDDAGSIGKRYRREDEIGTPYCITVDFQTVGDRRRRRGGPCRDRPRPRYHGAGPYPRFRAEGMACRKAHILT